MGDAMDMRFSVVGLARISWHLAMCRSAGPGANRRLQCGHSTRSSGISSIGAGGSTGAWSDCIAALGSTAVRADFIAALSASL